MTQAPFVIGITGASGSIYAARLVHHLVRLGKECEAIVSEAGMQVLAWEKQKQLLEQCSRVHRIDNFFAAPASGSAKYAGMAVIPCSMGTLGKIAGGVSDNLLTRAADVFLKERRPLVVVPREMPLSIIHLENCTRLARAGAVVAPACPHFYNHPQSIEDVADTVVGKVLDHLGVEHDLYAPWGQESM